MANYKIYLLVILLSIIVIGIVAVLSRYQREISAGRGRVNNLGSQVLQSSWRKPSDPRGHRGKVDEERIRKTSESEQEAARPAEPNKR